MRALTVHTTAGALAALFGVSVLSPSLPAIFFGLALLAGLVHELVGWKLWPDVPVWRVLGLAALYGSALWVALLWGFMYRGSTDCVRLHVLGRLGAVQCAEAACVCAPR